MASEPTDMEALVAHYLRAQARQIAAVRARDTPRFNRQFDEVVSALDEIEAQDAAGREALEALMTSSEPMVRYGVARRVLKWNPDAAVPVLAQLMAGRYPENFDENERFKVSLQAALTLFKYFKVRTFNENDLIEPLRAYGVFLPWQEERIWLE